MSHLETCPPFPLHAITNDGLLSCHPLPARNWYNMALHFLFFHLQGLHSIKKLFWFISVLFVTLPCSLSVSVRRLPTAASFRISEVNYVCSSLLMKVNTFSLHRVCLDCVNVISSDLLCYVLLPEYSFLCFFSASLIQKGKCHTAVILVLEIYTIMLYRAPWKTKCHCEDPIRSYLKGS